MGSGWSRAGLARGAVEENGMKLIKHGRITGRARQAYQRAREQRRWDERTVHECLFEDEGRSGAVNRVIPVVRGNGRLAEVSSILLETASPHLRRPSSALSRSGPGAHDVNSDAVRRPASESQPAREPAPAPVGTGASAPALQAPVVRRPAGCTTPTPAARATTVSRFRLAVAGLGGIAAGIVVLTLVRMLTG
ncbi:MAG: hypothetical protein C4547_01090 [Phycisphaerales bacterium]|nr:MAG: hypothetical protein C4547_01090 [Phycisphaerales bacterium]